MIYDDTVSYVPFVAFNPISGINLQKAEKGDSKTIPKIGSMYLPDSINLMVVIDFLMLVKLMLKIDIERSVFKNNL